MNRLENEPTDREIAQLHRAVMQTILAEPIAPRVWWPAAAAAGVLMATGLAWWVQRPMEQLAILRPALSIPRRLDEARGPVSMGSAIRPVHHRPRPISPAKFQPSIGIRSITVEQAGDELTSMRMTTQDPNVVIVWLMPESESVNE